MPATYTYDVFASLDGFASYDVDAVADTQWGGYWGKQGAELLLEEPLSWSDAALVHGDAVEVVARLEEESDVPLRSHGSLSMNQALMSAGLVDRLQVTIFPVLTGRTGAERIFEGAADVDLDLLESRTLDGRTQELIYRPTVHG